MAFLSKESLAAFGFNRLGVNVKISDKATIYNPELMQLGDHVRIDDFCVVSGKVSIGRNVHIAAFCNIAGGEMGVVLEDFSSVAYGCHLISQRDDFTGRAMVNPTLPSKYTNVFKAPVLVKRHSVIGTNCLILPGVTLEEGTAVWAMSMVTKSTEPWSVNFGIPAKRLWARKQNLLALEQEYLLEEKRGMDNEG